MFLVYFWYFLTFFFPPETFVGQLTVTVSSGSFEAIIGYLLAKDSFT